MNTLANLWVIGYDDVSQAEQARAEVVKLQGNHFLIVEDVVVVERKPDGSFVVNREVDPAIGFILGCGVTGLFAGLIVLQPLLGAAIGAALGGASLAAVKGIGMSDDFIREVGDLLKPGTSALFLLSASGDRDVLLYRIQGLGGKVLKTNVNLEWAEKVQAALESAKGGTPGSPPAGQA